MTSAPSLEGGCLCGEVRYRTTAHPEHRMVCHCTSCRRASGAPVVAWVTVPVTSLRFTRREPVSFKSSPNVTRTFCGSCGTPVTYQRTEEPGTIDITTCSFDDPDSLPPTHHSWLQDSISWVRFGDGLPMYRKTRSEG